MRILILISILFYNFISYSQLNGTTNKKSVKINNDTINNVVYTVKREFVDTNNVFIYKKNDTIIEGYFRESKNIKIEYEPNK